MCQMKIPLWLSKKNNIEGVEYKGNMFFACTILSATPNAYKIEYKERILFIPKLQCTIIQKFSGNNESIGLKSIFIDSDFVKNLKGVRGVTNGKYFNFTANILGENEKAYFADVNGVNYIVPKFTDKSMQTRIFTALRDNLVLDEPIYFYLSDTSYKIIEYDFNDEEVIVKPFRRIDGWASAGTPIFTNLKDSESTTFSKLISSTRLIKDINIMYPFIVDENDVEFVDDNKVRMLYLDAISKGMPKNAIPFIYKLVLEQKAN